MESDKICVVSYVFCQFESFNWPPAAHFESQISPVPKFKDFLSELMKVHGTDGVCVALIMGFAFGANIISYIISYLYFNIVI